MSWLLFKTYKTTTVLASGALPSIYCCRGFTGNFQVLLTVAFGDDGYHTEEWEKEPCHLMGFPVTLKAGAS